MEELIILGAGPAGLAAANAAARLDPLVLEAGPALQDRSHSNEATVVQGVGGAGLYSDGKFSFWPSASRLWDLDADLLGSAYRRLLKHQDQLRIAMPQLPASAAEPVRADRVVRKRYPSHYAALADREALTERLSAPIGDLRTGAEAIRFCRDADRWLIEVGNGQTVATKNLLLSTGRFGSLLAGSCMPSDALALRHLEVGVRIEQPTSEFFLHGDSQLDPKYIWYSALEPGTEWRTFCCCREGKVVWTRLNGLGTVSGRADCAATGWSNVGFNVRIRDQRIIVGASAHLMPRLRSLSEPIREPIMSFLGDRIGTQSPLRGLLGPDLAARLAFGLRTLMTYFSNPPLQNAYLVGPCLEGVGWYPKHDNRLATPLAGLWVAGDISGTFRGLTAALVSGYVAGEAIAGRSG